MASRNPSATSPRRLWQAAYRLFRRYRLDRACVSDRRYWWPTDARMFGYAAENVGLPAPLAKRLGAACFSGKTH